MRTAGWSVTTGITLISRRTHSYTHTHTHTHTFTGPFSGTTRVGRYQKGKINLDFTEAEAGDSEWQWHQLDHMQVCTSLQTDNHASTPPLSFLQAGCPSCRPTNSVKALKATMSLLTCRRTWKLIIDKETHNLRFVLLGQLRFKT